MSDRENPLPATLHLGTFSDLEHALADEVGRLQRDDPLRAVTIIVGSGLVRAHVRRALARSPGEARRGHANLHIETIHGFAARLAAPGLARRGLSMASDLARERLVLGLVRARAGSGWYFAPVGGLPGLPVALARTLDGLREACVSPDGLEGFARQTDAAKLRDLAALYRDYVLALSGARLCDDADLYAEAARVLREGGDGDEGGGGRLDEAVAPALVYGLYDLPEMQLRLLAALCDRVAAVFVPDLAAPSQSLAGPESEVGGRSADRLLEALGCAPNTTVGPRPAAGQAPPRLAIVSVPDERVQRREIAREVVRGAREGVAFHETAVVAAGAHERDALARALDAVGVPVVARLRDRDPRVAACRFLLDCLVPAGGRARLNRVAVLELASARTLIDAPPPLLVARWDALTRRARIVAGENDWSDRLARLQRRLEWRRARADGVDDDGDAPGRAELEADLEALMALQAFIAGLVRCLGWLPEAGSWPAMSSALLRAVDEFFVRDDGDPSREALRGLAGLEALEAAASLDDAASVARRLLDEIETPVGRVGRDGVAVLSPYEVRGLGFRMVIVADLAEGGFPGRVPSDTVLLDAERERLAAALGVSLETAERRGSLAPALLSLALQAARERAVLVLPRLDAGTGSPRLPSRVLLEAASAAAADWVDADEIERGGAVSELIRRVPASAIPQVSGAAARDHVTLDVRELDLALLLDRGSFSERGRAVYLDGLLGEAGAARRRAALRSSHGQALTPFDGQVDPVRAGAAVAALLATPIGPTALRSYIDCPFGFFARYLLGITVDEEPGLTLDIEPLDYGTLAHDILEQLYCRVADDAALGRDEALALLPGLVDERARRAERDGLTGYPLAWSVKRRQLLADLTRAVATDPVWQGQMRPAHLEWTFGDATTPPLELEVGGSVVRFSGRADRIDLSVDGAAAALIDYKTGKGEAEAAALKRQIDIQLRVYSLAAALLTPPPAEVRASYRLVTRKGGFRDLALDEGGGEVAEALRAVVGVVLSRMRAGVFPRWRESDRRCSYCDYDTGCAARSWVFERKLGDERLAPLKQLKEGLHVPSR